MSETIRYGLDEVVVHFESLEDPRSSINRQHSLVSVVVIAMMAVLAGAGGPTAIAAWAARKEELLTQVLDLPNGVPRKDVYRREPSQRRRATRAGGGWQDGPKKS